MSLADTYVNVLPDLREFGPQLDRGLNRIDGAKHGKKTGDQFTKGFGGGLKGLAAMATGAFAGLQAAAGIKNLFSDSIAEARDAAKVTRLTEAVIKSTGGAARVTAGDIDALAGALSNKIGVDDDAIQAGANLMLTFTNVRNEAGKGNDIFNQSVAVMNDMSAALGTDVKGSAIQLGKALNDPIKGVTALTRVGVSFTKEQKEQIKAMVESGNTMGAQKLILAELNKEFGGAAAAASDPAQKAQVAWANFKEELGTRVLPTVTRLATWFTEVGIPMLLAFADRVEGVVGWVARYRVAIGVLLAVLGTLYAAHKAHLAIQFIQTGALKAHILQMGIVRGATVLWTGAQWLLNAALTANPIGLVIAAIALLVAGIVLAYKKSETFREIVTGAWTAVQKGAQFMWDRVLKPIFRSLLLTWVNVVGGILEGAAKAFGWMGPIGGKLRAASAKFQEFKRDVNRALGGINDQTVRVNATYSSNYLTLARQAGISLTAAQKAKRRGLAYGGRAVSGPGTKHSDTAGLWALSKGEHIWTADEVSAAGGHSAVDRLRQAVMVGRRARGGRTEFDVRADANSRAAFDDRDGVNLITRAGMNYTAARAREGLERAVAQMVRSYQQTGGGGGGGNTLAWVRANLIRGLYISSTYRSPARNAAVGGSPTSLHMDARNPAVDIGGPTGLLDLMAARLRARGGWRELLWRVSGHYDHVHVADTGGLIRSGRAGLNLSGKPERMLSPQQTVAFERLVAELTGRGGDNRGRGGPMRLHPDDIRALGAELRAGMASANVETGRTANVYERTSF